MPNLMGLATRGALLALACFGLWLFGRATHHSGVIEERSAWQAKEAAAKLAATVHAVRVEAAQAVTSQRTADEVETARVAGRADAMRYAAGLLAQRNRTAGNLPGIAPAPGEPVGADQATVVDDALACSDNTVKAEGWLAWWTKEAAIPR